jgi:hypothetical protein
MKKSQKKKDRRYMLVRDGNVRFCNYEGDKWYGMIWFRRHSEATSWRDLHDPVSSVALIGSVAGESFELRVLASTNRALENRANCTLEFLGWWSADRTRRLDPATEDVEGMPERFGIHPLPFSTEFHFK